MRISDWSSDVCSSDLDCTSVTPTPRIATKARPLPSLLMLSPGDSTAASRTELIPRAASVSPSIAVTAIGTSDNVSSRLRAVTTMMPSSPASVAARSEEHTSELQSLMRSSYAVFCLKKKKYKTQTKSDNKHNTHN